MDELPNEILNNIFILLPITQKKECLFVCKKWEFVIRTQSLFPKIYVNISSGSLCERFIRLAETHPSLAFQVQELTLSEYAYPYYDPINFLCLFPNLKIVKNLSFQVIHKYQRNQTLEIDGNHKWKYFNGYVSASMIKWALKYPSTLVSITLTNRFQSDILDNDIIPLLKNAPLLNYLSLEKSPININQCEAIHSNAPALKSLKLLLCERLSFYHTVATTIKPAEPIKALNINNSRISLELFVKWNYYIGKKYPNLEICNQNIFFNSHDILFNISRYMDTHSILIKQNLTAMDFLCNADVNSFKSILNLLNMCHITKVRLYYAYKRHLLLLSESNQSDHIEKLEFYYLRENVQLGEWTSNMKSLKSLKCSSNTIRPEYAPFNLMITENNDLVEKLICLSDLVNFKDVIFSTIEELNLEYYSDWISCFQEYVRLHLPNLHKLNLYVKNREIIEDFDLFLNLPHHHFTLIDISSSFKYLNPGVKLETKEKTRFFAEEYPCKDWSLLEEGWFKVSENEVPNIRLSVLCDSVETLYFNSKLVLC